VKKIGATSSSLTN